MSDDASRGLLYVRAAEEGIPGWLADADGAVAVCTPDGATAERAGEFDAVVASTDVPQAACLERVREAFADPFLFVRDGSGAVGVASRADLGGLDGLGGLGGAPAFPFPADEAARLDAIERYDFDDATLRAHLDGLAEAVRQSLDARAGFVGIVGFREEHFLAREGVGWVTLPREDVVCAHGVLGEGTLVVDDLRADDRVSYDAISDEFDPVFYAGAPLLTPDDVAVGMLCVVDDERREFSADDDRALRWFADQAMARVERSRA